MGMSCLLVSDAVCADCKGPVTLFGIPDKVWSGLGLTTEWICLPCVAHRLAVSLGSAEIIAALEADVAAGDTSEVTEFIRQLIYIQRKKFRLHKINRYLGVKVQSSGVMVGVDGGVGPSLTVNEVMGE